MGELFGTVVQHRHDVGVVVLAVVVERVEEQSQADPFVRRAEHLAVVSPLTLGVPEGLKQPIRLALFRSIAPTRPSAPTLPRPVTRKAMSTSHQSKFVGVLVQMAPFWLRSEGAILTFSELAMASESHTATSQRLVP
jgi:hypothetical protein